MANIKSAVEKIRGAVYGEEVRESIAGAIEMMDIESSTAYTLVQSYEGRVKTLESGSVDASTKIKGLQNSITNLNVSVGESSDKLKTIEGIVNQLNTTIDSKIDDVEVIDGYLYLLSNGEQVAGPYGPFSGTGGGGGGGTNMATLNVSNTTGWNYGTFAESQDIFITLNWSSTEDGNSTGPGTLRVLVNGATALNQTINQGSVQTNLKPYIQPGSNSVKIQVIDVYGNTRTMNFTINVVSVYISSNFDNSSTFDGDINFTYTPVGSVSKVMHYILDGEEIGSEVVTASGRQQSYILPKQTHGTHQFEVYFTATVEGMAIESNHLFYPLMCVEAGNEQPLISVSFNKKDVDQYESIVIPYQVYTPGNINSEITIKQGDTVLYSLTVDRTQHSFTYRALEAGAVTLTITCGGVSEDISFTVKESPIKIEAETQDLKLYLSSYGRSNAEENPSTWSYGEVEAEFKNFNFVSDGWVTDEDGITVLRVSGDARLTIPFQIFATDFRQTGKTIEIEFATRNVRDYGAEIVSSMSGGRGISLTGQLATLKSEQSEISMQYKEDEHLRLAFVVEKRAENRLIYCYIDGVMSGTVQYPNDDDFSQTSPVGITIGSNDCTVDLYCIRVYDNDLTSQQVTDNWIADTQLGDVMMDRFTRNNLLDDYGQIVISKLPKDLPYLILEGPELPQYKGDKKKISGSYTDPSDPTNDFVFQNASINVQGTSSQYYARKNYKLSLKGVEKNGETLEKIPLRPGAIPVDAFTFKADVASSEGANNVELVRLYNEACPAKTPAMVADERVQWGIDGFPIVIFWRHGDQTDFIGKYNFNNDKGTEELYGFEAGDESWEIKNNTSDRVIFKNADFTGRDWLNDFEGRYPDGNEDAKNLSQFAAWVKSTDGNLEKFKAEFDQWCDKQSALFYWLFTELFLMIDSRAKNAFPTLINRAGKWVWLPYDFDTALGINNEGSLVFSYNLEDTDHLPGGADIFNGQGSVFWNNVRDAYFDDIKEMYKDLRSKGVLSPEKVEKMFSDHQAKWPEKLVNEDSKFKYLDPLVDENNGSYLPMLQGLKSSQRKWWLFNRFAYMDSKFNAGDSLNDVITVRGYAKDNVTVVPYIDIYPTVKYGSYLVSERGARGEETTLECPLSNVNDTEIYIYSASKLASVGDLSGFKVGYADFSQGVKLQDLKLGGAEPFTNENLTEVHLGNNELMKHIDLNGCTNLTGSLDVSGCVGLETLDVRRTALRGVSLPQTGMLKELYLPETISNLTIRNQNNMDLLYLPNPGGVTTLWLENAGNSNDLIDRDDPDFVKGKILEYKSATDELYFSNVGDGSISVSGYIPIVPIDTYSVEFSGLWMGFHIFFFDKDKKFISGIDKAYRQADRYIMTPNLIPENAAYIRMNVGRDLETNYIKHQVFNIREILSALPESARVRIQGFEEKYSSIDELNDLVALMDKFTGLDEYGNNVSSAQIAGTIYLYGSMKYSEFEECRKRYPYLNIIPDKIYYFPVYVKRDGTTTFRSTAELIGGKENNYVTELRWSGITGTPNLGQDNAEFTYSIIGFGHDPNTPEFTKDMLDESGKGYLVIKDDGPFYTFWEPKLKDYTVNFYNDNTLLETQTRHYGEAAVYHGETPVDSSGQSIPFIGWDKSLYVESALNLYAQFKATLLEETITDSWTDIAYHVDIDDYRERYSIGDTKIVHDSIEGDFPVKIAAFDTDVDSEGNMIPITWVGTHAFKQSRVMTDDWDSRTAAWGPSKVREYFKRGLSPNLGDVTPFATPSMQESRSGKIVLNESGSKSIEKFMETTEDTVWIPESNIDGNQLQYDLPIESVKTIYTDTNAETWLRGCQDMEPSNLYGSTLHNKNYIVRHVHGINPRGIRPVFATGGYKPKEITDSWEDIITYAEAGTASQHYGLGDWKELEGFGKAIIVAFDTDEVVTHVDAPVTGNKAGITFITSKPTSASNDSILRLGSDTTSGYKGFRTTNFYTNVRPVFISQLPAVVQQHLKMVSKKSYYTFEGNRYRGADDSELWLPSVEELSLTYGPIMNLYFDQTDLIECDKRFFPVRDQTVFGTHNGTNGAVINGGWKTEWDGQQWPMVTVRSIKEKRYEFGGHVAKYPGGVQDANFPGYLQVSSWSGDGPAQRGFYDYIIGFCL